MTLSKKIFTVFLFFILSSCDYNLRYDRFVGPSGKTGYFIQNCLPGDCLVVSGQLCPNGYNSLTPVNTIVGTYDRYIECK